jgi:hypothetical protein
MAQNSIAHVLTFPAKPQTAPALDVEAEGIVQLSRTLAYSLFDTAFDRLTVDERIEVIRLARTAWFTVQNVLDGTAAHIPQWERNCLTFSGPYDLALLEPQTGQVQES